MKVLAPHLSCIVNADSETDEMAQALIEGYRIIYVTGQAGLFEHRELNPGRDGKRRFVRQKVDSIPTFTAKPVTPAIEFLPDGKIPIELFETVKKFFRGVIALKKTPVEAMIWIMWSQEKGYFLHVPQQTVGAASASYDWNNLPEGASIIVDIHSHSNFGAFFSGTDNNDDRNGIRYSGVIGDNLKENVSHKWRFNFLGRSLDLALDDLFTYSLPEIPETPTEWLEKIGSPAATIHSYYSGNSYGYQGSRNFPPSQGGNPHHPGKGAPRANAEFSRHSFYHATEDSSQIGNREFFNGGDVDPKKAQSPQRGLVVAEGQKQNEKQSQGVKPWKSSETGEDGLSPREKMGQSPRSSTDVDNDSDPFLDTYGFGLEQYFGVAGTERIDAALAQMHRREQQESLIGPADTASRYESIYDNELDPVGDGSIHEITGRVNADGCVVITIPNIDIPPDFDAVACSKGVRVATAYAGISALTVDLAEAGDILRELTTEMFEMIPEGEKLALFRTLSGSLSDRDMAMLQTNGL